jgi:hypothetical protein
MKLSAAVLCGLLTLAAAPLPAQSAYDETSVVKSFRVVLERDPSPRELRRYALLMGRYGWTAEDVRRDLAAREDYRRYAKDTWDVDAVIRRAYLDILGREVDAVGLRGYREQIIRNGWSEYDLREELRRSPEYRKRETAVADAMIRRAYRDILNREPDPEGLASYRRAILEDGIEEHDLRLMLRKSDENRAQRREMRQDEAEDMVRRAYRAVLNREPDAEGLREYTQRIRRDGWSQRDVETILLKSDEYRNR